MKRFIFGSIIILALPTAVLADANNQITISSASDGPTSQPNQASKPNAQTPVTTPANSQQPTSSDASTDQTTESQAINCEYKIDEKVDTVPVDLVKKWAIQAAKQSFTLSFVDVDQDLKTIEKCYTKEGWKGFNTALQRSGNLETIKKEKLAVSPSVNGEVSINKEKDNEWKVTLPMTITYQSDKNKINQELNVNILIGRQTTGNLGIMQLIAAPAKTAAQSAQQPPAVKPDNKPNTNQEP